MKNEQQIILEILKYENDEKLIEMFNNKSINWIEVLGYLTYHRVAGLVYEKMNNINIRLLDYPVFLTSYMINESQKIRAIEQNKWINKISEALTYNNITHVFLKGSVLNSTLFSYGSRVSNDIDLLINKKNIVKATEVLNNLGFIQGKFDYKKNIIKPFTQEEIENSIKTRGETAPFIKISDNPTIKTVDVDINFSLDWNPNTSENTISYFLDNRIQIENHDKELIYSLNDYHNFMELCVHLYKDSALIDILTKRKVLDLYKFVDIYYFIKSRFKNIEIAKLYEEIKKFKLEKYIYFALTYITELFPDAKTKDIENLLIMVNTSDEVLNTIFDQYNPEVQMTSTVPIHERIFSYDVIKNYSGGTK